MLGLSKSIIIGKTRNTNRFLYEYTFVEKEESKYIIRQRFRLQNKLLFPVKKCNNANQLNYILFNEIFFKKQNKQISFDQSRFYNGIQWSARQTTLSIGYQYVYQITAIGAVNKNQWLLLLDANFWRSY